MMKILDWFFLTYYHATIDKGSRFVRANFLLWFSSSFIWVAFFYSALILLEIQIGKNLFLPIFISVFTINYYLLQRVYIKTNRSKLVIENGKEVTRGFIFFSRFFVFLSIFVSIGIMLIATIYYGKNIGFL